MLSIELGSKQLVGDQVINAKKIIKSTDYHQFLHTKIQSTNSQIQPKQYENS